MGPATGKLSDRRQHHRLAVKNECTLASGLPAIFTTRRPVILSNVANPSNTVATEGKKFEAYDSGENAKNFNQVGSFGNVPPEAEKVGAASDRTRRDFVSKLLPAPRPVGNSHRATKSKYKVGDQRALTW